MMRPVDRLRNGRRLVLAAGDTVLFCAILEIALTVRDPHWFEPSLIATFLPALASLLLTAYAAGLYELRVIRDFVSLIGGLLGSMAASAFFCTTYFYLLSPYLRFAPKITLLLTVVGAHAAMFVWRRGVLLATDFKLGDLNVLILGDETYAHDVRGSLGRRAGTDFNLVGTIAADVDLVVIDRHWSNRHAAEAGQTLTTAIANLIPVVRIDEFHESMFGRVSPEYANNLDWVLDHVLPRSSRLYFGVKRIVDAVAAAVFLVLLAPVMAVVATAIRLIDGVSPLYAQMRVGYVGRPFRLWKFQTMREDAEREGPFVEASHDPRVTRLGSLLRRLRIDELPQLWNVLKGDMSLVGPRPEWIREVEILEKLIPTYRLRYLVPPGITGWAQVYYCATHNLEDAIEKHNYDLYYLKHFSLALDFSIMLKTIKRVIVKELRPASVPAPVKSRDRSDLDSGLDITSIVGRS